MDLRAAGGASSRSPRCLLALHALSCDCPFPRRPTPAIPPCIIMCSLHAYLMHIYSASWCYVGLCLALALTRLNSTFMTRDFGCLAIYVAICYCW